MSKQKNYVFFSFKMNVIVLTVLVHLSVQMHCEISIKNWTVPINFDLSQMSDHMISFKQLISSKQ